MRLITGKQAKELDRAAITERGISSLTLMERAAAGLAEAVMDLTDGKTERPRRSAVFAGPGNNGGDGTAAACLLLRAGWQVRVFLAGSREKLTADHREMVRRLEALGGRLEDFVPGDGEQMAFALGADVIVDALFGVGLNAPLRPPAAHAVALMNQAQAPVVSADIPSGVEADTGRVLGFAVEADITVTFSMAKLGLFVGDGALRAGRVRVWDIGLPPDLLAGEPAAETVEPWMPRGWLPRRPADGHKGTFGRAYLLCGSAAYTGAPVLAARGAARGGCDLVTVGVPAAAWSAVAARCLTEMPVSLPDREGALSAGALPAVREGLRGAGAALIGPGLGRREETAALVRTLTAELECPLVLDADGINALAGHIDVLDARRGRATVLTPHDGEFARLGGDLSGGDRLGTARAFARAHGCVLVLKGHRTITAAPDGRCYVNTTGGSGLAKGGSGDVLAGLLASLLAQGMEAAEAAALAVWIHGRAGDLLEAEETAYAMSPADLPGAFSRVFRELTKR